MSGATRWNVDEFDPKAAEAASEQARRHGLTLGEYLNQAILAHEEAARQFDGAMAPGPVKGPDLEGDAGWALNGADSQRMVQALERLAERVEAGERRAALSMTGLDRTVLGLAARVEDAEAGMRQASAKVSGAVDEMRRTGETIAERVQQAELVARETAEEIGATLQDFNTTRQSLIDRLHDAEGLARRAAEDVGAQLLAHTREAQAELAARIEDTHAFSREVAAAAAAEISAAQTELAERMTHAEREAREAALEAVRALRADQQMLVERLAQVETSGKELAAGAVSHLHAAQAAMQERLATVEQDTRRAALDAIAEVRTAHTELAERLAASGLDERTADQLREIESAQRLLAARFENIEVIARESAAQAAAEVAEGQKLIEARLEQIEQATREAAANLRMGAAAAINQVRAAQLDLEKRVKLVEAGASFAMGGDSEGLSAAHAALEERIERIEKSGGGAERAALHMLDAKITGLAQTVRDHRERTAHEIERVRDGGETAVRIGAVERTVEDALARLTERLVSAETAANDALRKLEAAPGAAVETEALRTIVEARLETMAATMTEMVGGVRAEIADKLSAGGAGDVDTALADVNRRVAASERRQAQTIEAISIEIRRMSESIDRRLRSLETRNDDSAAVAVREEIARLAATLEDRVSGLESREIAGVEKVGVEMGRLAERFDERFDGVERRSAEAIEHVGEQVARMAERFSHRQDQLAAELTERIVESEERQASRLNETVNTVATRIKAAEERTATTLTPVQKAMANIAARLQAVEDGSRGALASLPAGAAETPLDDIMTAVHFDREDFMDEEPEEAPAQIETAHEALDVETIDAPPPPSLDPFDQFLPPPAEGNVKPDEPAPQIHAEANDLDDFSWDDPDAPVETAPVDPVEALFTEPEPVAPAPQTQPPTAKSDYLANARRAVQASATRKPTRGGDTSRTSRLPIPDLRGPNRVVLWSTAGALALALAGGAYLIKVRANTERAAEPAATPDDVALTPPIAPPEPAPLTPVDMATEYPPEQDAGIAAASIADAAAKAQADTKARAAPVAPPPPVETTRSRGGARTGPQAAGATIQNAAYGANLSLSEAAVRGDAVAQYELGLQRLTAGQTADGVSLLRRAANQGLAMAQYRLAKLFERGEGVPADLVAARQWTERAAAAGNRKAMHDLGVFYARGEGAPLDEATAFRWFRQAAELGVADSQFNLGVLYQQGRGTQASAAEALYWFAIAARSGDNDARARAATLEAQLTPDAVRDARTRAQAFAARPASARANGEFGVRVWSSDSAQAGVPPRS